MITNNINKTKLTMRTWCEYSIYKIFNKKTWGEKKKLKLVMNTQRDVPCIIKFFWPDFYYSRIIKFNLHVIYFFIYMKYFQDFSSFIIRLKLIEQWMKKKFFHSVIILTNR